VDNLFRCCGPSVCIVRKVYVHGCVQVINLVKGTLLRVVSMEGSPDCCSGLVVLKMLMLG
jgi:hypothetical protein